MISRRKPENCEGAATHSYQRKEGKESSYTRYFTGITGTRSWRELVVHAVTWHSGTSSGAKVVPCGRGAEYVKIPPNGSGNRTCRKGGKPSYGERSELGDGARRRPPERDKGEPRTVSRPVNRSDRFYFAAIRKLSGHFTPVWSTSRALQRERSQKTFPESWLFFRTEGGGRGGGGGGFPNVARQFFTE